MTKKQFLLNTLLSELNSFFQEKGFKLNKANRWFTKRTTSGWEKVQLIFLDRAICWEIIPVFMIRVDAIENIYHSISHFELKYRSGTPTIGIRFDNLNNESELNLNSDSDITDILFRVQLLFQEKGMQFFNQFSRIPEIDRVLNSDSPSVDLTGPIFKGFKAIISAHLVKRKDFDQLEKTYREYYTRFGSGFYLKEYERLVKKLAELRKEGAE